METNKIPDFIDLPQEEEVHKMNRGALFEQVLVAEDLDKLLIVKMLFNDLKLTNMVKAGEFFNISPNGVRKTKKTLWLGGKEFTQLVK